MKEEIKDSKMTGHTPGPWEKAAEYLNADLKLHGVNGYTIDAGKLETAFEGLGQAAATDLLAALENLVSGLEDAEQDINDETGEELEDIKEAREAIRKAKGV